MSGDVAAPSPAPPVEAQLLCESCWSDVDAGWRACRKCGQRRPPDGWTLMPFVVKGRFHMVRRIARGGMGAVFEAIDQHNEQRVAVKLAQGGVANEEVVNAFEHEMEAAGFLTKSPHFVTVLGWDGAAPAHLAMEFVEWPTLSRQFRIGRYPMEPLDVARLGIGVCRGLELLRDHNLVHRDLKPDNLFVQPAEPEWRVKIADLGGWQTATDPERSTLTTSRGIQFLVGTPRYMSPEQMYNGPLTNTSDVHSLASILWLCVSGDVPYPFRGAFNARNREAINERYRRMQRVPDRPPGMPEGLYLVLSACLDIDPARRPSARKLRQSLEAVVRALPQERGARDSRASQLSARLVEARSILQDATDLHRELGGAEGEEWFEEEVHALDAKLSELRSELDPAARAPSLHTATTEATWSGLPEVSMVQPRSRLLAAAGTGLAVGLVAGLWGPMWFEDTHLRVAVSPSTASIFLEEQVDGETRLKQVGTGEVALNELAPGGYVLRFKHPNFKDEARLVELSSRGQTEVDVQMDLVDPMSWRPTEGLIRVQLPEQRARLGEIRQEMAQCTGGEATGGHVSIYLDGAGRAAGLETEGVSADPIVGHCLRRVAASVLTVGAGEGNYSVLSVELDAFRTVFREAVGPSGYELAKVFTTSDWSMGAGRLAPRHLVTLTPFHMGTLEVTQGLWKRVTGEQPPLDCTEDSEGLVGDDLPVICVSWNDAVRFANQLSEFDGLAPSYNPERDGSFTWVSGGEGYRLPTESEWEFAARGPDGGPVYAGSDGLPCLVGNLGPQRSCVDGVPGLAAVGTYRANGHSLYDMTGNVSEWVWDLYGAYPRTRVTNPRGARRGRERVVRGGDWADAFEARVVDRSKLPADTRLPTVGFRLARDKYK